MYSDVQRHPVIFQQDKDPEPRAKTGVASGQGEGPRQSPDLDLTEYLWTEVEMAVANVPIQPMSHRQVGHRRVGQRATEGWTKGPQTGGPMSHTGGPQTGGQ